MLLLVPVACVKETPELLAKIEDMALGCHSPSWPGQEPSSGLGRPHHYVLGPGQGSSGAWSSSLPLRPLALECGERGLSVGSTEAAALFHVFLVLLL